MAERTKEVGVRLSVKDADLAKRALSQFGSEGQAALKRIEDAGRPASASLLALSAGVEVGREKGSEFFKEMAMSTAGSVTAFLTLGGAIEGVKRAIEDFSKINDEAKASGLDPEFFQGIAHQAELGGVSIDQLSVALEGFNRNSGQASQGFGRMLSQLQQLDPALARQIQLAATQEQRVRLVADAISKETDRSKAAAIATAAFGDSGQKLVDIFADGAKGIDQMLASARDMGLIIPDDLITRADELGDKLDTVSKVMTLQFEQGLIQLAPDLVEVVGYMTDFIHSLDQLNKKLQDFYDWEAKISQGTPDFAQEALDTRNDLDAFVANLPNRAAAGLINISPDQLSGIKTLIDDLEHGRKSAEEAEKALNDLGNANPDLQVITQQLGTLIAQLDNVKQAASVTGLTPDQLLFRNADYASLHTIKPPATKSPPHIPAPPDRTQEKIDAINKSLELQLKNLTATDLEQAQNNALSRAGIDIDDKRAAGILANVDALYKQREALDSVNQAADFLAQTGEGAIEGMLDRTESLTDAVGELASSFLKAALQAELLGEGPLAGILGTGSDTSGQLGGLAGNIASWLHLPGYATGTADTGGTPGKPAGVVHGREAVIPLPSGGRVPVQLMGGMAAPQVNVRIVNQSGQQIDAGNVKQSRNSSGGIDLEVMLAQAITKPGGQPARGLETQYGLRRQLTRR